MMWLFFMSHSRVYIVSALTNNLPPLTSSWCKYQTMGTKMLLCSASNDTMTSQYNILVVTGMKLKLYLLHAATMNGLWHCDVAEHFNLFILKHLSSLTTATIWQYVYGCKERAWHLSCFSPAGSSHLMLSAAIWGLKQGTEMVFIRPVFQWKWDKMAICGEESTDFIISITSTLKQVITWDWDN